MSEVSKEIGVFAVLAKRMVEERLPKALALKERVDHGEVLNELDVAFLEQVIADAGANTTATACRSREAGITAARACRR